MTTRSLSPLAQPDVLNQAIDLAERVARTEFVPSNMRSRPEAVLATILTGHELGVGPMVALANIDVINGRPAIRAHLMRALLARDGHYMWPEESTITRCVMVGRRADNDQLIRVAWTMDDAKRAGLANKENWRAYPRHMLTARATAELARLVAPDTLGGLYTLEELEDDLAVIDTPNGPPEQPPTKTRRRRTRRPAVTEAKSLVDTTGETPTVAEIRAAFAEPEPPPVVTVDEIESFVVEPVERPDVPESPPPAETLQLGDQPAPEAESPQDDPERPYEVASIDDLLDFTVTATENDDEPDEEANAWVHLSTLLAENATSSRMTTTDLRERIRRLFSLMADTGIPRWGKNALRAALQARPEPASSLDDLTKFDLVVFCTQAWDEAKAAILAHPET